MNTLNILRIFSIALPQIFVLLLLGGAFDLLGGWNHTDSAFGVLIALFLLTPIVTAILLTIEIMIYRKRGNANSELKSFFMPGLAIFLFFEAVAINVFLLSQVRMH